MQQNRVIAMNIILYQSFYLFLPKQRTFKFKPRIQTVNGNKRTSSQPLKLDTVTNIRLISVYLATLKSSPG